MKKTILLGVVLTTLIAGGAFAQGSRTSNSTNDATTQITPQQRQNMAAIHEKMAACLRSDKPIDECRTEMQENCQEMAGGCPMAGMGRMGMMHGGTTGETAANEPPKDVISMDKAEATAVKKYPGVVTSSEFEQEDGRWIYSFDIRGKDAGFHEVWVDAKNGKIVKHEVESAGDAGD